MATLTKKERKTAEKAAKKTVTEKKTVSDAKSEPEKVVSEEKPPAVDEKAEKKPFECPENTIVDENSEGFQEAAEAIDKIRAEKAQELELFVSKLPESLTAEQSREIVSIYGSHGEEEAARNAKNLDETNKEVAEYTKKINERADRFKKYVSGDLEVPADLDEETKEAVKEAQKNLPRDIMCKGSHSFCSINEMSRERPGYSINFLKSKGILK